MIDPLFLIASFAGGIFGAAVGALPSFILCGIAAIIGAGITQATGDATFSNVVAWGPLLGPQVAFAGGAAAAAYAAKVGKLENGKDIATGLMGLNAPDVLLVGGLFGVLGYVLQWALNQVGLIGANPWTNTIAMSVVINALIVRLVFGKTGIFGKVRPGDNRWVPSDVAAWLPYQSDPKQLLLIGVGVGLTSAYTMHAVPELLGLFFGITAAALIFLQFGVNVPVSHHIGLAAGYATVASGGNIWWGLAFGILGVFLGEVAGCVFHNHGDNHVDPPSVSLFITNTITAALAAAGILSIGGIVPIIVVIAVAVLGYVIMSALRAPAAGTTKAAAAG